MAKHAGGRPTKYDKKYIQKVYDYILLHQDEEVEKEKKEGWITYSTKVKLPTIEGFARYIGVNKTTLYEWEVNNPEFSNSLDEIRVEQKERLINMGLAGEYNSTIAKLILSSNHGMREKSDVTSDDKTISPLLVKIIGDGDAHSDGVQKTS